MNEDRNEDDPEVPGVQRLYIPPSGMNEKVGEDSGLISFGID